MQHKPQIRIRIEPGDSQNRTDLRRLATTLDLPDPDYAPGDADFYYVMSDDRLELHRNDENAANQSPLYVDFLSGPTYFRYVNDRTIRQPLARAAGIKQGYRPTVLDATAGFGEDSFVLAALGCNVTMVERSPFIWALLENGINRSRSHPEIGPLFQQRVDLIRADSLEFMSEGNRTYNTVFLDPMYPHTTKSALNKQRMRMLRALVGDDTDASHLLRAALLCADRRVVVKRPARAGFLAELKPSFSTATKSSRFDIYLVPYL